MGTWSTRIFDDDGAADIRAEYRILLGYKVDPEQAWQLIYDYFYPDFKDSDDEDVFWLSIALYQWQNGILKEEVKQRALECIDDESYLAVWKESGTAEYMKRKAVLTQLKDKLLNEVNTPRKIAKCPPYYRIKTRFSIGDVFSYTHENGNISYIEVVRIRKTPVTKLAPELDYQSDSDFALLDVWSKRQYSLEELAELPYRRYYRRDAKSTFGVNVFDTVSVFNENVIQENMNYLGGVCCVETKEPALFGKSGMEPFPQTYTQCIESTFSLPCGITNEMLNIALEEFLNDSTIETFEQRIRSQDSQWPQSICNALHLLVMRNVYFYADSVRSNHILKREMEERDTDTLWHQLPWISEENAKRLADKVVPNEENAIETDYAKRVSQAINQYFNFLKGSQ